MSKEIKFRAWDKINEEMIDFQKEWTVLEFDSGEVSNIVFKESEYYLGKDEFILMQYVGLHDKNGVEIYEFMELDNKYKVIYIAPNYVLQDISSGDIIDLYENKYTITKEYTEV